MTDEARAKRVEGDGPAGMVPGLLFLPADRTDETLPLMLLGHGGGGSKDAPRFTRLATTYSDGLGVAVLVIDGPVHGERVPTEGDQVHRFRTARRALSDAATFAQMPEDWRAAGRAAATIDNVSPDPVAYAGFSMGTIYGVPTVAALPSIKAAVFGVGGFVRSGGVAAVAELVSDNPAVARIIEEEDNPDVRNGFVRKAAASLADREVLMLCMSRDEAFPLEGALELFDTFACPKRLALWEGGHLELPGEAIDLSVSFIRRVLGEREFPTGIVSAGPGSLPG